MHWYKTETTYCHAQLGLPYKCCEIKGLIVHKNRMLTLNTIIPSFTLFAYEYQVYVNIITAQKMKERLIEIILKFFILVYIIPKFKFVLQKLAHHVAFYKSKAYKIIWYQFSHKYNHKNTILYVAKQFYKIFVGPS